MRALGGFSLPSDLAAQKEMLSPKKLASEKRKRRSMLCAILMKHLVFSKAFCKSLWMGPARRSFLVHFLPTSFYTVLGGKGQWILRALGRVGNSRIVVSP